MPSVAATSTKRVRSLRKNPFRSPFWLATNTSRSPSLSMSNHTAPTVRRGSSTPSSFPTLAKRAPSFRNSRFGASRTATNRSRSPSPSKSTKDGWRISPMTSTPMLAATSVKGLPRAVVAIQPRRRIRAAGEADEQVRVAVGVEVAPRRGSRVGDVRDTRIRGDIHEPAARRCDTTGSARPAGSRRRGPGRRRRRSRPRRWAGRLRLRTGQAVPVRSGATGRPRRRGAPGRARARGRARTWATDESLELHHAGV